MGHGVTWFTFLPFYSDVELWLQSITDKGLLFGSPVVATHVFGGILTTIILMMVGIRARAQLKAAGHETAVPPPDVNLRNFIEVVFEALYKQAKQIIGKDATRYFPVIATLALFIFVSNILGLVSGFAPPTDNWNTTFGCSIFVFLYYNFHGMRAHGLGHIGHMANPAGTWWGWFLAPLMFPLEVVSHCARPFSLGVRLAANMTGDHAVLFAFLGLVPILVPLPFMALGLMVCVIQTLVFVLLTMIYIGLAVADAHGDDHGHGEEAHAH